MVSDAENDVGMGRTSPIAKNGHSLPFPNDNRARHGPVPARDAKVAPCLGSSARNATWLILPVVICLSQRLSHACVSMN